MSEAKDASRNDEEPQQYAAAAADEDGAESYDLINLRAVDYEEDATHEIVGRDDVDTIQYVVHQPSDDEEILGVEYVDEDSARETSPYLHVVERDSIPLVFYSSDPQEVAVERRPSRKRPLESSRLSFDASKLKYFLYNCKHCEFKCNAIKELTAHKSEAHSNGSGRYRFQPKRPAAASATSQSDRGSIVLGLDVSYCSVCSYSSVSPDQVKRHISNAHGAPDKRRSDHDDEESTHNKSRSDESQETPRRSSPKSHFCKRCGFGTTNLHKYERHSCKARG